MSAQVFKIKRTNLLPSLKITLSSTIDFDLSTALSAAFVYRFRGRTERITKTANIIDAPNKIVRVDWISSDVDEIGTYEYQVEVTFTGGVMTFPSAGFDTFQVVPTIET